MAILGLGLYGVFKKQGSAFIPQYKNLLASTGEGTASELASRFGIDLRSPEFWKSSLDVIGKRIDRYLSRP